MGSMFAGIDLFRAESSWVPRTKVGGDLLTIPGISFSLDTHGEKFADPWVLQGAAGSIPDDALSRSAGGTRAAGRIDTMLSFIDGAAGDTLVPAESVLTDLGEILRQRADSEALRTRQSVWRGWDYIVEKSGGSTNFFVVAGVAALKWLTTTFDPSAYGASAKAKWTAVNDISAMLEAFHDSVTNGIVYPWHAWQLLPLDVPKLAATFKESKNAGYDFVGGISSVIEDTSTDAATIRLLDSIAYEMQLNNRKMRALPASMQAAAQKVFAMFLGALSDPFVGRVFRALPSGTWGASNLATDEQVMIVAAAVGHAYGMDRAAVRDLAIRLYDDSPGWSGHPSLLTHIEPGAHADVPTNATQIQWGDLAERALSMVEGSTSTGVSTPVLVAGGVLGLGALAWALL